MTLFPARNSAVISSPTEQEAHALVTYRVDKNLHGAEIFEEIAIGQTLGAWDERFTDVNTLRAKVAKIISFREDESQLFATIAFPVQLWHGRLSWLLALIFGKMSFYRGVTLENVSFDERCLRSGIFNGPQLGLSELRERCGAAAGRPLLMGILKPNVAMSDEAVADLYCEVAHAGVHLVKDDEIRHDESLNATLRRIESVAARKAKEKLNTQYVVHAPIDVAAVADLKNWCARLQSAGADALLVNVWTSGLDVLQNLRAVTKLPLVAHPALAGAMGQGLAEDSICPSVLLGSLLRAAGADLTLFPSPYGKIGLPKPTAVKIAEKCTELWSGGIKPVIPVPSAGIKPEHVPSALEDFGDDFILNAGTAIFASGRSVADSAKDFLQRLEALQNAR